jgi:hypothetical protein
MKAKCLVATALTTVTLVFSLILAMPVSAALDDVKWECYPRGEPVTSGMEISKWAGINPEDGSLVCVPVDRNIGLPKSDLVKCECEIWSDIDDIDAISFLTGDTRYIWAKNCENIRHCECKEVAEKDCSEYCENLLDHGIWDEQSEYPECACICEKGWEMTEDGCVACSKICEKKGGNHYIYDPDKSYDNACECKCEDGYEYDYYNEKCEKKVCPLNSTNVVDFTGSCPKDRKLNRHCCCDEGYINYMGGGVCIKKEDVPGTLVCGKWGCQEGEDCLNCPEDCVCAPGICDPFSEYVNPENKCSPKVAYLFISSDLNCYLHYWCMYKLNELKGRYRSLGYKTIVVRLNGDVIDKLSNPSTKAIAYFAHGAFPSLEGLRAWDIRDEIETDLISKYGNLGMSNAEVRQRAGERSLHPNLDYAYIHTCHSLDDETLANYLLRPGGTYWGKKGLLFAGLQELDEYVKR